MAAGLGFKDFVTGEVLTAADVDGYLMQGIWVFASAAARDSAVTSPQEGNFAYLKDTNTTTYYTGSAWTNLDTTGMVNPMTTTGDTIYSSSGSTPARLGIGSTGQVLTVAGGVPSWATPSAGGTSWTLLNSGGTALTGAQTVTVSGISAKNKLLVVVDQASSANASAFITLRLNTDTGNNYYWNGNLIIAASTYANGNFIGDWNFPGDGIPLGVLSSNAGSVVSGNALFDGCNTAGIKSFQANGGATKATGNDHRVYNIGGYYNSASTISSVSVFSSSGNLDAGTVYVYTSA
jgi:hypothetical protein